MFMTNESKMEETIQMPLTKMSKLKKTMMMMMMMMMTKKPLQIAVSNIWFFPRALFRSRVLQN